MDLNKLKQKAKEYISDNCKRWEFDGLTVDDIANEAYLAGAEPREKQIQIDAEQIRALQKQNGELTDELAELKALLNCNNCSELSEEECGSCAEYSHFKCKRKEQLTKAKEIIKDFLLMAEVEHLKDRYETVDEAEQFLSEVEK